MQRPAKEQDFFQECNIYWVPSSDPTELYAQLAQYKFREIPRHKIKYANELLSSFGHVVVYCHNLCSFGNYSSELPYATIFHSSYLHMS